MPLPAALAARHRSAVSALQVLQLLLQVLQHFQTLLLLRCQQQRGHPPSAAALPESAELAAEVLPRHLLEKRSLLPMLQQQLQHTQQLHVSSVCFLAGLCR
jgi:hypothetical protein